MRNPYPRTHPGHTFQQWITDRIRSKELALRQDGSGVIRYMDERGTVVRAFEATDKELATMEPGEPVMRPVEDIPVSQRPKTKAVRKRRRPA